MSYEEVGSKDQVHVLQLTSRSWELSGLLFFLLLPSIHCHLLGGLDGSLILVWQGWDDVFAGNPSNLPLCTKFELFLQQGIRALILQSWDWKLDNHCPCLQELTSITESVQWWCCLCCGLQVSCGSHSALVQTPRSQQLLGLSDTLWDAHCQMVRLLLCDQGSSPIRMSELEVCWWIVSGLSDGGPSVSQVFHRAVTICRHLGHDEVWNLLGSCREASGLSRFLDGKLAEVIMVTGSSRNHLTGGFPPGGQCFESQSLHGAHEYPPPKPGWEGGGLWMATFSVKSSWPEPGRLPARTPQICQMYQVLQVTWFSVSLGEHKPSWTSQHLRFGLRRAELRSFLRWRKRHSIGW